MFLVTNGVSRIGICRLFEIDCCSLRILNSRGGGWKDFHLFHYYNVQETEILHLLYRLSLPFNPKLTLRLWAQGLDTPNQELRRFASIVTWVLLILLDYLHEIIGGTFPCYHKKNLLVLILLSP